VLAPDDPLFSGIPPYFSAGRYHSLHVRRGDVPDCLQVTAETGDGVVMAVRHRTLPIVAVQFHPESVMTLHGGLGRRLVRNVVDEFCRTG
jgi:anthranilate synthase